MSPVLIGCSHGTSSPEGRAAVRGLLEQCRTILPGVDVREAFVDVQEPALGDALAGLSPGTPAVIVPLLLSPGFHTTVDIEGAARRRPGVVSTPALGPHDLLALVLESRLEELGLRDDDAIVLAAAGSRDPASAEAVRNVASRLAVCVRRRVHVGFTAGPGPRLPAAIAATRRVHAGRVVAATYMLAPGHFADQVRDAGADAVTMPLAPDPRVAAVVAERYHGAVAAAAA
ncbi:sirohydrochlorin chelatase [Microbacterium sp. KR10-403]|uniref:sirohydrochlorin chelatase n=1 Tax=Microbacterium sp. KR10-403 TaxID=3158581 RepID=UPI0032E39FA1